MTTATLTLFDLTDLNPDQPRTCGWCNNQPATTRVYATQNLLGLHPTWMTHTWYRHAAHRAHSGLCCDRCAWNVASSWWNPTFACPHRGGACRLWAHTLADPLPGLDCTRHHREHHVVWLAPLGVAS
jgi:hypothetical protein